MHEKCSNVIKIWQMFGHINWTWNYIQPIRIDSADFVELITKIQAKFHVDL